MLSAVLSLAIGLLMSPWVLADEPSHRQCWQLYDAVGGIMLDRIEWAPTSEMTPYAWAADDRYRFTGQARLFKGPGQEETAQLVGANTTSFFGGNSGVLLIVIWPDGRMHSGRWLITAGPDSPFKATGMIEPVACEPS